MLGLFKKNKSDPGAAAKPQEKDLKSRFARAVHGDFFRTQSFAPTNPGSGNDVLKARWLEAHQAGDGCRIMQVGLYRSSRGQALALKKEKLADAVAFFAAVEYLVNYELSQDEMSFFPYTAADDVYNPKHHVKAFAEAEGLVFNDQGMPIPTTEFGHIIHEGIFSADAEKKAQAAALSRVVKQFTIPPLPDDADPIKSCLSGSGLSLSLYPELNDMGFMLGRMKELATITGENYWTNEADENSFFCDEDNCYATEYLETGTNDHNTARENYFDNLKALFQKPVFAGQEGAWKSLTKAFELMALFLYLSYLQEARSRDMDDYIYYEEAQKGALKCLKALELSTSEESSPLLDHLTDPSTLMDEKIPDKIILWFEAIKKAIDSQSSQKILEQCQAMQKTVAKLDL